MTTSLLLEHDVSDIYGMSKTEIPYVHFPFYVAFIHFSFIHLFIFFYIICQAHLTQLSLNI